MMTPSQMKNYEFKTAGRNAYKSEDVDSFFAEVLIGYEKIYRENGELIKRVSLLADKLESYKCDEVDIKQAVLSAQKAADIITRDAEESAKQTKEEADNILAAAKGEADIIKADAEKQAIADSDLLLAMARDKAEDIIKKAKEKAHGILIAANNSASDTVGAANRTITSESIHYDMLKKEVSEFRASILAQYKAHIEMISKLPELAVEEAGKIVTETPEVEICVDDLEELGTEESIQNTDKIMEINTDDNYDNKVDVEADDVVTEETADSDTPEQELEEASDFLENDLSDDDEPHYADIPISKKISVNTDNLVFDGLEDDDSVDNNDVSEDEADNETTDDDDVVENSFDEDNGDSVDSNGAESVTYEDVYSYDDTSDTDITDTSDDVSTDTVENKRNRYNSFFGNNTDDDSADTDTNNDSFSSFFDSIETIESDDSDDSDNSAPKSRFSFFRKKK